MLLSQFPMTFLQIHKKMSCFIVLLMTILKMIGTIFMKLKLLLLAVNFVSGFRLEVIPHLSIRSSLTHLRAAAIVYKNHFFHLYKQIKSSECKVKFRQASNHCKSFPEAAKIAYASKTKQSISSQKLGSPLLVNCQYCSQPR